MRKCQFFIIAFLMFLCVNRSQAQDNTHNYGVKMGINYNKYRSSEIYYYYKAKRGLHISFFYAKNYDDFRIQPSVMFIQKVSTLEKYKEMKHSVYDHILSFIEVPFEFSYKVVDFKLLAVRVNFEPYIGYCLKAIKRDESKYEELSVGRNDKDALSPINAGLRIGLSFEISRFEPYFCYDIGLKDISPYDGKLTNNGASMGIAFHF